MVLLSLLQFLCVRIRDTWSCAHVHMYDWEIENSSLFPRHKARTRSLMMCQKLIIASSEFHKNLGWAGTGALIHSSPIIASRFALSRTDRFEHEGGFLGKSQESGKQTDRWVQREKMSLMYKTRQLIMHAEYFQLLVTSLDAVLLA